MDRRGLRGGIFSLFACLVAGGWELDAVREKLKVGQMEASELAGGRKDGISSNYATGNKGVRCRRKDGRKRNAIAPERRGQCYGGLVKRTVLREAGNATGVAGGWSKRVLKPIPSFDGNVPRGIGRMLIQRHALAAPATALSRIHGSDRTWIQST